jgi:hypothetical protein
MIPGFAPDKRLKFATQIVDDEGYAVWHRVAAVAKMLP